MAKIQKNGKRKAESGKLFRFSLVVENETDAAERAQRALAHYAEPRGGKACEAGLKRKAENFFELRAVRGCLRVVKGVRVVREKKEKQKYHLIAVNNPCELWKNKPSAEFFFCGGFIVIIPMTYSILLGSFSTY